MAGRGRTVQPEGTSSAIPQGEPHGLGEPPRARKSDRLGLALVIAVLAAIVVALFVLLVL